MKRYGSIIGVKPEKLEEYKKLHVAVWPEVLAKIKECNIVTTRFIIKTECCIATMNILVIITKKICRRWQLIHHPGVVELTDPCQQPVENRAPGEWWLLWKRCSIWTDVL